MITADSVVDVRSEPSHNLRFENELVRAYWIELAPGAATEFHRHERPYAGLCLGDSVIRNEVLGAGATRSHMHCGDVIYTPGKMTQRIENVGASVFQNVTVEVLRKAGQKNSSLRRLQRERRNIQMMIDERSLRVANLELAPGERCDLIGNHLVVRLRGDAAASTFAGRKSLRSVGSFAWCCGVATVESTEGGRLAIVEIA